MKLTFKKLTPLSIIACLLLFSGCKDDDPCEGFSCPANFTQVEVNGVCQCVDNAPAGNIETKEGFITADETWTADKIYTLIGKVVVDNNATLTIEPGTIVKGTEGTGSLASALLIARGSKINACGTESKPIIFTSFLDDIQPGQTSGTNLDETQNGLWGGLIILGNAPGSFEGDVQEFQIEGIPANDTYGLYGGPDIADNSGTLCYVSVRHGGASIGENNEINGITFGGVGAGTQVNNIEVVGNLDDGIEFFGGTVNVNNALVWAQGDDAFDIDQAYAGTLNNIVYIAGPDSDHGLEIDGPEGSATGGFNISNGSFKGLNSEMADFRKSSMGILTRCSFFNFPADGDLEIDDNESSANYTLGALAIFDVEFVTDQSIADICHDKSENADESVFDTSMTNNNTTSSSSTQGANTNLFDWTFANEKGALNF